MKDSHGMTIRGTGADWLLDLPEVVTHRGFPAEDGKLRYPQIVRVPVVMHLCWRRLADEKPEEFEEPSYLEYEPELISPCAAAFYGISRMTGRYFMPEVWADLRHRAIVAWYERVYGSYNGQAS